MEGKTKTRIRLRYGRIAGVSLKHIMLSFFSIVHFQVDEEDKNKPEDSVQVERTSSMESEELRKEETFPVEEEV